MDWFLYDNGLRHERVNTVEYTILKCRIKTWIQILANLVPVTDPKYCSNRTNPLLHKIPTIKFEFRDPFFCPWQRNRRIILLIWFFSPFCCFCYILMPLPHILEYVYTGTLQIYVKWNLIIQEFFCQFEFLHFYT